MRHRDLLPPRAARRDRVDHPVVERPFSTVFSYALQGRPCTVLGLGDTVEPLPVEAWRRAADEHDDAILDHCQGPTLDIGCGPGRMTAALAGRGTVALGIDVVDEAVGQAIGRGATALRRDVFDVLPGEGRWATALLADGNVGIGGDPVALLRRVGEIVDPRGRAVVEVRGPGVAARTSWVRIESAGLRSRPFRWAVVGIDHVAGVASRAGWRVVERACHGGRWCVVLEAAL
ncbi:methyltransferase domain-containing protein [Nocardioides sp. C4-1]|uniref:methyltransferase domain-containing protein n=1 Tax=Nocardioides sp. C4-1 TaxID=3151851 RepID=UPI0032656DED